jgi:MoaA/NifB/PqqE/SkfB family radical SAM enzyme
VPDYTTEELKGLIDSLYRLGTRYLNIHGGETLLRDDIGEIVDYIKSKGIYCCLITNGSLLRKRINEIRNVDNITISLDGRKENNDKNRGEGSFDAALNAIKLAKKEGLPLRVSVTITKHTMNDIGYMAALAKEYDFTVHFSILFKPLPQARDCEMTNEEIRISINQILEFKKRGYPIFTSATVAKYARDWPLDHNEEHYVLKKDMGKLPRGFKHIKCFYGKIKFTIEADGKVFPCFLLGDTDKFNALNWKDVGIEKAIEHVRKTNVCMTCQAAFWVIH